MTPRQPSSKIRSWDEALLWRKSVSGRVVFTNGVFDLLHPGHIDVLFAARSSGDALIVGLNSDESVRRLKGPARPVQSQDARASLVAALECVDGVTLFPQDTPLDLIRHLSPDILVKGGDYSVETIVGAADVLRSGGEVRVIPLTPGHSSTNTIDRLRGIGAPASGK